MAVNLLDGLLTTRGFYLRYPQFAHWEDGSILLFGPVLYFYSLSVIYRDFRLKWKHALHLIPFFLLTANLLLFYHSRSEEQKFMIENAVVEQKLPSVFYIIATIVYFHIGLYIAAAIQHVYFYRRQIKQNFSEIQKIDLNWLLFLLVSIVGILVLSFAQVIVSMTIDKEGIEIAILIVTVFLFVFVNLVVLRGLRHPSIFSGISSAESASAPRAHREKLEGAERRELAARLKNFMAREKPYLKAELSLDNLAGGLDVSPKKLSQLLNDHFSQNFFDFINTYRIEEAERVLKESRDPGLTVLEVMYQCGFNSKSSFNSIFKKKTGLTPSAYRQQALSV